MSCPRGDMVLAGPSSNGHDATKKQRITSPDMPDLPLYTWEIKNPVAYFPEFRGIMCILAKYNIPVPWMPFICYRIPTNNDGVLTDKTKFVKTVVIVTILKEEGYQGEEIYERYKDAVREVRFLLSFRDYREEPLAVELIDFDVYESHLANWIYTMEGLKETVNEKPSPIWEAGYNLWLKMLMEDEEDRLN